MGSCHTADMHRQPAPAQCHIPPHLFPLVAAVPEQQGLWAEHLARKSAQQGGIPSVWSSSSLAPGLWQGNGFGACLHESGMQPQINSENRIQYRALVSVGRRGLTPQRCLNSPAGAAGGVAPLGCGAPSPAAQRLERHRPVGGFHPLGKSEQSLQGKHRAAQSGQVEARSPYPLREHA